MHYSLLTIRGLTLDSRSRIKYGFTLNGFTVNGTSFAGMTFVVAWISIFVTIATKPERKYAHGHGQRPFGFTQGRL